MPRKAIIVLAAACLGIAAALALVTMIVVQGRGETHAGTAGQAIEAGVEGQPTAGGPFTLINQDGETVDETLLDGKWSLVFFGFTYCPDYCPTTLAFLKAMQAELGAQGDDLQMIFVSVDPARDTPGVLKDYLSSDGFPEGVIGLTGTPDQIAAAARAYNVFYSKSGEGEAYTMNHSLAIWLMGPDGKARQTLNYELGPDRAADIVRRVMARG